MVGRQYLKPTEETTPPHYCGPLRCKWVVASPGGSCGPLVHAVKNTVEGFEPDGKVNGIPRSEKKDVEAATPGKVLML